MIAPLSGFGVAVAAPLVARIARPEGPGDLPEGGVLVRRERCRGGTRFGGAPGAGSAVAVAGSIASGAA
ncbi:hypothetical protein ACU4GR_23210 [Methylobacterium oryzae CBMB20]